MTNSQQLNTKREQLIKDGFSILINTYNDKIMFLTDKGFQEFNSVKETWHKGNTQVRITQVLNPNNTIEKLYITTL